MRLDHLLSRDLGACGGRGARAGASRVLSWPVGRGRTNSTGARSPLTLRSAGCVGGARPSCCCFLRVCVGCGGGGVGACCRGLGLRALCVLLLLPPVVWGLWGCGWVGCELYSGREYLCSLWCVFVVCLASWSCCCCGGVWGVVCLCCVLFLWAFGGCLGTRGR